MRPYGCPEETRSPAGPLAPDLTRATTFAHESAERLRAVGAGEAPGWFYARYGHAAARTFESEIAAREGADGAVCFASGMAALHAVFCALCSQGDVVAAPIDLYGGTASLLHADLPRFGIEVTRYATVEDVDPRATLILVETPTNPLCRVVDVAPFARRDAIVCVDATFAPPPLQCPLAQGADLVMHSATKFLGGHHDVLAGVVAGAHALLEPIEAFRRRTGGVLAPDSAWLLHRSLRTLDLRVERASATAARLATLLREKGLAVFYPDLGAMLAFAVPGGLDGAAQVYDRFHVIGRAPSLGGVDTIASLPPHTSHRSAAERERAGIPEGLIRLSVGLEPFEVLRADLLTALEECP